MRGLTLGRTSGERTGMLTSSPTVPADFSDQLSAVKLSHWSTPARWSVRRVCGSGGIGALVPCSVMLEQKASPVLVKWQLPSLRLWPSHPNSNWSCVVTASDKLSFSSALYLAESIALTFFFLAKAFLISGRFICIIIMNSDLGRTSWTNEQVYQSYAKDESKHSLTMPTVFRL